jgi:tetratricopeptide (TPR) repeat protein
MVVRSSGVKLASVTTGSLGWFAVLLLSACTTSTPRDEAPVETRELPAASRERERSDSPFSDRSPRTIDSAPQSTATPGVTSGQPTSSAAAASLIAEASQLASADQYERAGSTLERAISIEPENPLVWHRLAALRLSQQRYDQVVAMAQKSNRYAADWILLRAANWELIAQAKTAMGDSNGAANAWAQARESGSRGRPR